MKYIFDNKTEITKCSECIFAVEFDRQISTKCCCLLYPLPLEVTIIENKNVKRKDCPLKEFESLGNIHDREE